MKLIRTFTFSPEKENKVLQQSRWPVGGSV